MHSTYSANVLLIVGVQPESSDHPRVMRAGACRGVAGSVSLKAYSATPAAAFIASFTLLPQIALPELDQTSLAAST